MEIEVTNIQESDEQYSLSKPTVSGKASLLSRMAKMGQSILPKMQTSTTTDSEDTEVFKSDKYYVFYNLYNQKCVFVGWFAAKVTTT